MPDKDPAETNFEYCRRVAAGYSAEEILTLVLKHLATKRRGRPVWSFVGEATSHGSGVSSAIVERFCPGLDD